MSPRGYAPRATCPVLGNVLARLLLASAAHSFGIGVLGVPAWVDADVAVAMCGLTGIAALVPARRATAASALRTRVSVP